LYLTVAASRRGGGGGKGAGGTRSAQFKRQKKPENRVEPLKYLTDFNEERTSGIAAQKSLSAAMKLPTTENIK